jgi:hypothetical protein
MTVTILKHQTGQFIWIKFKWLILLNLVETIHLRLYRTDRLQGEYFQISSNLSYY